MRAKDSLYESILKLIEKSGEPLETKEIEKAVKGSRVMALYRLNDLRGEGRIRGKHVGSGKGTWIWWKNE